MRLNAERIRNYVIDQLEWDDSIDASDVRVEVSNGSVTLSGTVPTYTARRAAEIDALAVPGVTVVDNQLTVQPLTGRVRLNDDEIAHRINKVMEWDSRIDQSAIRVLVSSGRVVLEGTVDAYWKKLLAEDLVADITGVTGITNALGVVPSESVQDQAIGEDIAAAIARNAALNLASIDVEVKDGVAILSGKVPNAKLRRAALNIARRTSGVVDVVDNLTLA